MSNSSSPRTSALPPAIHFASNRNTSSEFSTRSQSSQTWNTSRQSHDDPRETTEDSERQARKRFSGGITGMFKMGRKSPATNVNRSSSKRQRTEKEVTNEAHLFPSTLPTGEAPSWSGSQVNQLPEGSGSSYNGRASNASSMRSGAIARVSNEYKGKSRASLLTGASQRAPEANNLAAGYPTRYGTGRDGQAQFIDQGQLIQMALSLSESRRLHLGPGQLAATSAQGVTRSVSGTIGAQGPSAQNAFIGSVGSPRGTRQQFTGVSMASPRNSSVSNYTASDVSALFHNVGQEPPNEDLENMSTQQYTLSQPTLMRAEKARMHFELAHEYRRVLASLPPLKPKASLSGSNNLGRAYNPLQYIRNRQVRARERQAIDTNTAGWNNLEAVRLWVDMVEIEAQNEDNRDGDVQLLPSWNSRLRKSSVASVAPWAPPGTSDLDPATSKPKWDRLNWSIAPADLLADAYWLEQGGNKALIENRYGARVFDKFQPTTPKSRTAEMFPTIEEDTPESGHTHRHSRDTNRSSFSPPRRQPSGKGLGSTRLKPSPSGKKGRVARVKNRLLHLGRDGKSQSESDFSDTDDPDVENFQTKGTSQFSNIGPLEKHMKYMLASQPHGGQGGSRLRIIADQDDDLTTRRGGVSSKIANGNSGDSYVRKTAGAGGSSGKGSVGSVETPRISIEDTDAGRRIDWDAIGDLDEHESQNMRRSHSFPLNHQQRGFLPNGLREDSNLIEHERIDETDFAFKAEDDFEPTSSGGWNGGSGRSSLNTGNGLQLLRHATTLDSAHHSGNKSQNETESLMNGKLKRTDSSTFFKAGRIGDIVRNEQPRFGKFAWKKHPAPQVSAKMSPRGSWSPASESDDDDVGGPLMLQRRERRRSMSTNDLSSGNYNLKELPKFKSAGAKPNHNYQESSRSDTEHQSQRHAEIPKTSKNRNLFGGLAPASSDNGEVSPGTSSLNLSRRQTMDSGNIIQSRFDRDGSQGDISAQFSSRAAGKPVDKRLRAILAEPGGVGKGGLPMTGLAGYEARQAIKTRFGKDHHHHWSIADELMSLERNSKAQVDDREIAYVEALLLSTGVKAKTIEEIANGYRNRSPQFLIEAARLCNTSIAPVVRRQEHVVAARLLSQSLEKSVLAFEEEAERFRSKSCTQLQMGMDDLRQKVGSKLTPLVRSCADDADAFIAQLTTTYTLSIKQINDSIDVMQRSRRRRLRYVRTVGFKMLEWVLVGIMWWIWLFVYVLKMIKGVVFSVGKGLRWAFVL